MDAPPDDDDDDVVCLSPPPTRSAGAPEALGEPWTARSKTSRARVRSPPRSAPTASPRRKHKDQNKDWVAACAAGLPRDGPAFVYVIYSERRDMLYVGETTDGDEDAIAAAHDRGTRAATRARGRGHRHNQLRLGRAVGRGTSASTMA